MNKKDIVDAIITGIVIFIITGVIRLWYGVPLDTSWVRDAATISVVVIGFEHGLRAGFKKKKKKEPEKEK